MTLYELVIIVLSSMMLSFNVGMLIQMA